MKLATFLKKFEKTVLTLSVNEAKVTLANVFTDNIFALKTD